MADFHVDNRYAASPEGSGGELLLRLEIAARHTKALFARQQPSATPEATPDARTSTAEEVGIDNRQGKVADDALRQIIARLAVLPWPGAPEEQTAASRESHIREQLLRTAAGRALFMPLPLKEPAELFFIILLGLIARGAHAMPGAEMVSAWLFLNPDELQRLFELSVKAQKAKMHPEKIAVSFLESFAPVRH